MTTTNKTDFLYSRTYKFDTERIATSFLAPLDFFLLWKMEIQLKGSRLEDIAEIQTASPSLAAASENPISRNASSSGKKLGPVCAPKRATLKGTMPNRNYGKPRAVIFSSPETLGSHVMLVGHI
jgi:hypothetical protein